MITAATARTSTSEQEVLTMRWNRNQFLHVSIPIQRDSSSARDSSWESVSFRVSSLGMPAIIQNICQIQSFIARSFVPQRPRHWWSQHCGLCQMPLTLGKTATPHSCSRETLDFSMFLDNLLDKCKAEASSPSWKHSEAEA